MEYYLKAWKNYTVFEGRTTRQEYWMFILFNFLISIGIGILDKGFGMRTMGFGVLGSLYMLTTIVPSLAVGARRLHDTGRSGWWQLIAFIPIIGFIILIVFLAEKSAPGDNQYGHNPDTGLQVPTPPMPQASESTPIPPPSNTAV